MIFIKSYQKNSFSCFISLSVEKKETLLMTLHVDRFNTAYSFKARQVKQPDNLKIVAPERGQLSKLLFGKKASQNITFGWSKNVDPVQEKILDLLTDGSIKSAVVGGHKRPDGDAYGSVIGIAGVLKSLGVSVFPVIDDNPPGSFLQMPSALEKYKATDYIKRPSEVSAALKNFKIKNPDVAIMVDTPYPDFITDDVSDLISKAKKVIIIDHHPDDKGEPTNLEKWLGILVPKGVSPENVIYWREHRTSAAEMVGELDKEIAEENDNRTIAQYNPCYYKGYRLAVAGGISADAGGIYTDKGNVDNIKIARLSKKKVQSPDGKLESITRNMFNWLVKNSEVKNEDVDIKGITRINLPDEQDLKLDYLLDGLIKAEGIEVKVPSETDPLGYIYIKDYTFLDNLVKEAQIANPKLKINQNDLTTELKKRFEEKITSDVNTGVSLLVKESKGGNCTMSIRSYGYETLEGETYIPGHVFTDGLATKINTALQDAGFGDGGGHSNAKGFRSNKGVGFKNDILPIIEKVIKENTEGIDIKQIPAETKAKKISFSAKMQNQIDLTA